MFDKISEKVEPDSSALYLYIPKEEFMFMYDNLDRDSAQNLVDNYFKEKGRDGIPHVKEITEDIYTQSIKIEVEINYDRNFKLEEYKIPDSLNGNRL